MGHVVVPVDPVKTRQIGRSESEEESFTFGTEGVRNVAACPDLQYCIERGRRHEKGGALVVTRVT